MMSSDLNTSEVLPRGHSKRPLSIIEEHDSDDDGGSQDSSEKENYHNKLELGKSENEKHDAVDETLKSEEANENEKENDQSPETPKVEIVRSPSFKAIKQFFIDKTDKKPSDDKSHKKVEPRKKSAVLSPHAKGTKPKLTEAKPKSSTHYTHPPSKVSQATTKSTSSAGTTPKAPPGVKTAPKPPCDKDHGHSRLATPAVRSVTKPRPPVSESREHGVKNTTTTSTTSTSTSSVPSSDRRTTKAPLVHHARPTRPAGAAVATAEKKTLLAKRDSGGKDAKLSRSGSAKLKESSSSNSSSNSSSSSSSSSSSVSVTGKSFKIKASVKSGGVSHGTDSKPVSHTPEKKNSVGHGNVLSGKSNLQNSSPKHNNIKDSQVSENNNASTTEPEAASQLQSQVPMHYDLSSVSTTETALIVTSPLENQQTNGVTLTTPCNQTSSDVPQTSPHSSTEKSPESSPSSRAADDTANSSGTSTEQTISNDLLPSASATTSSALPFSCTSEPPAQSSSSPLTPSSQPSFEATPEELSSSTSTTIVSVSLTPSETTDNAQSQPSLKTPPPPPPPSSQQTVNSNGTTTPPTSLSLNVSKSYCPTVSVSLASPLSPLSPSPPPSLSSSSSFSSSLSSSLQTTPAHSPSPKLIPKYRFSPTTSRRYSMERNQSSTVMCVNGKILPPPSIPPTLFHSPSSSSLDNQQIPDTNTITNLDDNGGKDYGFNLDSKSRLPPRLIAPVSPSLSYFRAARRGSYYFRRKQSTDSLNSLSENEILDNSDEAPPISPADLNRLKETADRMHLTTKRPSILHWRQTYVDDAGMPRVAPILNAGDPSDDRLTSDRKQKINDALEWLQSELLDMRSQDQALARQLLSIRQDINQLKLQRCTEEHQILLDDFKSELEELEEFSDVLDLPHPIYFEANPLKHIGITRHNMNARRFSAC